MVLQDTDLKNPVLVLGRVGGGGQSIRQTQTKIGLGVRVRVLVRIRVVVMDKIRAG